MNEQTTESGAAPTSPSTSPPERRLPRLVEVGSVGPSSFEERLEEGDILYFPPGLMPLPVEEERSFLRESLPAALRLKNISYHPDGDYISGIKGDGALKAKTSDILRRHNDAVAESLGVCLPRYASQWRRGKVNFRPLEERGRKLGRHASNELIHTDAFASGATHGDRVLRYFSNLHPEESRCWRSAGTFGDLFAEFGSAAGIDRAAVNPGIGGKMYSGLLNTLSRVGLPQAVLVDTSPYDRSMRRFHNFLKDNDSFQEDRARQGTLEFPPMSAWAVLTDGVSHAVISGRHALVNTFHVRLQDCVSPELAPYNILASCA